MELNQIDDVDNSDTTETCPVTAYQRVQLCVPVSVHPFAKVGAIITKCCEDSVITVDGFCEGTTDHDCNFTIKQRICIEIPVEFGADVNTGETLVLCEEAASDMDEECDDEDDQDEDNDEDDSRIKLFGNR